MLSVLRLCVARHRLAQLGTIKRCLATETNLPADEEERRKQQERKRYEKFLEEKALELPTRPQLNIKTKKDHGLYHFFRQVPVDDEGNHDYETVESRMRAHSDSGRSWKAIELRRKSFRDLHTLWYVLLRERNLLATQAVEADRLGISSGYLWLQEKDRRCRKSMARIKQIMNERRLAYEQAYTIDAAKHLNKHPKELEGQKLAAQQVTDRPATQEISQELEGTRASSANWSENQSSLHIPPQEVVNVGTVDSAKS